MNLDDNEILLMPNNSVYGFNDENLIKNLSNEKDKDKEKDEINNSKKKN